MISVLLAPTGVATRRLDVSIRRRTNPNFRPCWWNGELLDTEQPLFVADQFSFRVQILEIFALCPAAVARPLVTNVLETGFLRGLHRISHDGGFDCFPVPTLAPTRSHSEKNHSERLAPLKARPVADI